MQVHYINLDRRPDRNESFLGLNAGIAEFQRSPAVEGARLRTDDLIRDGLVREPLRAYTPGTLGSALSHKKLWDQAILRRGNTGSRCSATTVPSMSPTRKTSGR